jgi:hypothetical protein
VNEAITNAILQSGVRVLSQWNIIDYSIIESNDKRLIIESVKIEKEGEIRYLACDAIFFFREKRINLKTFLGKLYNYIIN